MAEEKRQPWMKWYPADWRSDPRLRMCSLAARGLWADLITYMHEGQPYGHLTVDGIVPNVQRIAGLVGRPLPEVRKALAELEGCNVFSRTESGVIYSRRMVRDKAKADRDRDNGKGGGNPSLAPPDNQKPKGGVNPPDKAQKPEARDQKPEESPPPPSGEAPSPSDDLKIAAEAWNTLATECGLASVQRLTTPRKSSLVKRLEECGGLLGWNAALERVRMSPFLRGENDRGWRADFDFLLQAKTFTKLMEGGYDRSRAGAKVLGSDDAKRQVRADIAGGLAAYRASRANRAGGQGGSDPGGEAPDGPDHAAGDGGTDRGGNRGDDGVRNGVRHPAEGCDGRDEILPGGPEVVPGRPVADRHGACADDAQMGSADADAGRDPRAGEGRDGPSAYAAHEAVACGPAGEIFADTEGSSVERHDAGTASGLRPAHRGPEGEVAAAPDDLTRDPWVLYERQMRLKMGAKA